MSPSYIYGQWTAFLRPLSGEFNLIGARPRVPEPCKMRLSIGRRSWGEETSDRREAGVVSGQCRDFFSISSPISVNETSNIFDSKL